MADPPHINFAFFLRCFASKHLCQFLKCSLSIVGWYCCDRKSRAACAQSFAPWQQATIEITRRDHSFIACSRHIDIFLFFAHIPFVVNHTINTTPPERLQQHPLLFATNHTDRMFFVWRLNSARPPHPGHSTILLRSEISSSMCAKLCTVAASNNRDHPTRSLFYCLFAPRSYIFVLRAHPARGESYNQRNTTGEVATILTVERKIPRWFYVCLSSNATWLLHKALHQEIYLQRDS